MSRMVSRHSAARTTRRCEDRPRRCSVADDCSAATKACSDTAAMHIVRHSVERPSKLEWASELMESARSAHSRRMISDLVIAHAPLKCHRDCCCAVVGASGLDLVLASDLISDEFRSGPHKALLFANVLNVDRGEEHPRDMTSGQHTIQSIFCKHCQTELGWTYVRIISRTLQQGSSATAAGATPTSDSEKSHR